MENIQEVQLYGPTQVKIGGVNVGHTDETGVKCKIASAVVEAKAGKFGDAPVKKWLNGQRIEVEFMLIQSNFALLQKALPGSTLTTDASQNQKLTWGSIAGTPLPGVLLELIPYLAANTPLFNLTIPSASPVGPFSVASEAGPPSPPKPGDPVPTMVVMLPSLCMRRTRWPVRSVT